MGVLVRITILSLGGVEQEAMIFPVSSSTTHPCTAGAVNGKIRIVAEGGDVDPDVPDHLKDIFFVCELCTESVYDHIPACVSPPYTSFTAPKLQPSRHARHLMRFWCR